MGTRFNIVIPNLDDLTGGRLITEINQILDSDEALMSCHRTGTELWHVNKYAYEKDVTVSREMAGIIDFCQYSWEKTGGAFDAGLLLHGQQAGGSNVFPLPGWHLVKWESSCRSIRFTSPSAGIDLGGIGKGWALEKISSLITGKGIASAFISFGDSSITGIGAHPLGRYWEVEVSHPLTGVATMLKLNNQSFSVSGLKLLSNNNPVAFIPHVISAGEGKFITENNLVVVKHDSALIAEVLSTAVLASTPAQLKIILDNFPGVEILYCQHDASSFNRFSWNNE